MVPDIYMDEFFKFHYPSGARHSDGLEGTLSDDILLTHWKQFPPQHPVINLLVGCAFILLLSMSILGNGCVLYIFLKTNSLRTPSNFFTINLAFSDLCMMLTHGLPVGINIFLDRYWMWGETNCRLFAMFGGIFGTGSIMTMVLIGYDRYNVIVRGMKAKRISKNKALAMIAFLWTYTTATSLPPFFGWGNYSLEGFLITCSYDYISKDWNRRSYVLFGLITHFLIPMLFVVFFYAQIVKAVVSHERAMKAQAKKMNVDSLKQSSSDEESAEIKIAKVAATNVALWVGTWTPYALVVTIGLAGGHSWLTPTFCGLPSFLLKTTSSLNPLVFAIVHPKYREALAKEIPCLGIGKKAVVQSGDDKSAVTSAP